MRIGSRTTLTKDDVYAAAQAARRRGQDIHIDEIAVAPRGGIQFYCVAMHGTRRTNGGRDGYAAKWSAWGWLIAELYKIDPDAKIGQYKNVFDFVAQCHSMHEAREHYAKEFPRSGPNPYAPIDFLDLVSA